MPSSIGYLFESPPPSPGGKPYKSPYPTIQTLPNNMSTTPPESQELLGELASGSLVVESDLSSIASDAPETTDTSALEVETTDKGTVEAAPQEVLFPLTEEQWKEAERLRKVEVERVVQEDKRIRRSNGHQEELGRVVHLDNTAVNRAHGKQLRNILRRLSKISKYWIESAYRAEKPPLEHGIIFGEEKGERVCCTLEQVHALIPQIWQYTFRHNGYQVEGDESWLNENLMNVLVHLGTLDRVEVGSIFGISLAAGINGLMDRHYENEYQMDYLEHLVKNVLPNPSQYPGESSMFIFPAGTDRIVWFWNYWGNHWTLVESNLKPDSDERWDHTYFNSIENHNRYFSTSYNEQVLKKIDNVEQLIQELSGFQKAMGLRTFDKGLSPKQWNHNDCGVFAVYNAISRLTGDDIDLHVSGMEVRARLIELLLRALERKFGPLRKFYKFGDGQVDVASDTSAAIERSSSPVQSPKVMPSSPPDLDPMPMLNIEQEITAAMLQSEKRRSSSPEAVNIFTPSSSPPALIRQPRTPTDGSPGVYTAALALSLLSTPESDPFNHSPKRKRSSSCPSRSPRSVRRSVRCASMEADATASDTLFSFDSSAMQDICAEPCDDQLQGTQSSRDNAAKYPWRTLFPPAKPMSLDSYVHRERDFDNLVECGVLNEDLVGKMAGFPLQAREAMLEGLVERYKAGKDN